MGSALKREVTWNTAQLRLAESELVRWQTRVDDLRLRVEVGSAKLADEQQLLESTLIINS